MKNDAGYLAIDPVCGMKVDPAEAAASHEFAGVTYHFCSAGCHRKFSDNPAAFIHSPADRTGEREKAHGHSAMPAAAATRKQLAIDEATALHRKRGGREAGAAPMEPTAMAASFGLAIRGCSVFMAAAAAAILVVYGVTLWSLLAVAILLACPVYVLWSVAKLDAPPLPKPEDPSKEHSS